MNDGSNSGHPTPSNSAASGWLLRDELVIRNEIIDRLGSCPAFFMVGKVAPGLVENLWRQTEFAYLDNPLPEGVKERLFTYLSRYCSVPYCVVRHAFLLLKLNESAVLPDGHLPDRLEQHPAPLSSLDIVAMLDRPARSPEQLEEDIQQLTSESEPLEDWPQEGTPLATCLFHCAISIFLRDAAASKCLAALEQALSEPLKQRLLVFLSFVRAAHFWVETHRELQLEPEIEEWLAEHPVLVEWIETYGEKVENERLDSIGKENEQLKQQFDAAEQLLFVQERAMASTSNGILITDPHREDNPIIYCNPAAEAITGYNCEEMLDRNCRFLQGEDRDQPALDAMRTAIRTGQECHVTLRNYRKDGTLFWNEQTISPVKDADGNVTHFIGILNDITERRQTHDALVREKRLFEDVVRSIPEALLLSDVGRVITFCNPSVKEIFGYQPMELVGQPGSLLYANQSEYEWLGQFRYCERGTVRTTPREIAMRRHDGTQFIAEVTSTPLWTHSGEPSGYLAIVRDVTDRKHAEAEQRRYYRVLDALSSDSELEDVLKLVLRLAQEDIPSMLGGIYLSEVGSRYLRKGYTADLPEFFTAAIISAPVGQGVGPCSIGVKQGNLDIVEDVLADANWTNYKKLAETAGVRACWAIPIHSPEREVIGALAMYFRLPQAPTPAERNLLHQSAQLVGLVIDRAYKNQRLRESEQRYRSVVMASSSMVWSMNAGGEFVTPQLSWQKYTGQRWDQYSGWGWAVMIHPEDRQFFEEEWRRTLSSPAFFQIECRIWNAATEVFHHTEIRAVPIFHDNGSVREWIGTTTDIHQRTLDQEQLSQQEYEFRMLADNVPELFSYIDDHCRYVFVNRQYEIVHDRPRDQIIGLTVADLIGQQAFEQSVRGPMQRALAGERVAFENQIDCSDGKRWMSVVLIPEQHDDSPIQGVFALVRDVTERRNAEEALRINEERLSLALQATNDAIWDYDLATGETWWNEVYAVQFGRPNASNRGRAWWQERLHPDDRERVLRSLDDFAAGHGESNRWTAEYRFRRANGSYAIIRDRAVRAGDQDGKPTRILGAMLDISEQRSLEKRVLDIAADESRRIGNDLHDGIGQELTGLAMMADTLVTALIRKEMPEAQLAKKIETGARRTLQQARKLARGMNPVDVDAHGLMSALSEMCDRMREWYDIECDFECQTPVLLRDNQSATQLFRIAQEAATNAVKHGKARHIRVCLQMEGRQPQLKVTDNGVGMDEKTDSTTGMGMRIMGYRAGIAGGDLQIQTGPDGGTEVVCKLPQEAVR